MINMNKLITIAIVSITLFCQQAYSCDEDCLRSKAEASNGVSFPGFLTWKYCDGIAMDFMTSAVRSLDSYRTKYFSTKYKGPLKNTKSYLAQRKDWLLECDNYMKLTKEARIFNDDKTTQRIFASIDRVDDEFNALIKGVSYSSDEEAKEIMDEKIDSLFQLVDDHKTIMHLKGRYVVR